MTATIEQRGKFTVGGRVEFLQPHGETFTQTINFMRDADGLEISAAPHARQLVTIPVAAPVEIWSLMRDVQ